MSAAIDTFGDVVKICFEVFAEYESESGKKIYEKVVVTEEDIGLIRVGIDRIVANDGANAKYEYEHM
jgi:hypothetical protein